MTAPEFIRIAFIIACVAIGAALAWGVIKELKQ